VVLTEQLTIDREVPLDRPRTEERVAAERAARESLRGQVAKLELQLSGIVARGFPYVSPGGAGWIDEAGRYSSPTAAGQAGWAGPHLLSLAELERARDRLVGCVRLAQEQARERAELEVRSRDLLERMRLEPGRYKFVRLRVADLGERGCGVWEVRPRLGLIGMLAGWWELKLSSGCPLPRAVRSPRAASPGASRHGPTRAERPRGPGARQNTSSPRIRVGWGGRAPYPRAGWPLTG
jgi:hypothetical protein